MKLHEAVLVVAAKEDRDRESNQDGVFFRISEAAGAGAARDQRQDLLPFISYVRLQHAAMDAEFFFPSVLLLPLDLALDLP